MSAAQEVDLLWFARQGGEGLVDRYGRVVAGGMCLNQGHTATFLRFVAWGMIEGRDGRLLLTERGRVPAARLDERRVEGRRTLEAFVESLDDEECEGVHEKLA